MSLGDFCKIKLNKKCLYELKGLFFCLIIHVCLNDTERKQVIRTFIFITQNTQIHVL